jgi:hypothetical protein
MPNSQDYRLYLEEKFGGITKLVNAQFESLHDRQDSIDESLVVLKGESSEIKKQTIQTNDRVTHLEEQRDEYMKTRVSTDMLNTVCTNLTEVKETVEIIDKDLEEYRIIKKYPKLALILIVVFAIGLAISAYGTFRTVRMSRSDKKVLEKVELLEQQILNNKANE